MYVNYLTIFHIHTKIHFLIKKKKINNEPKDIK